MAWAGFSIMQKADPYHDASGKFTSAGGEGSALASDAVKVLHHGQQYTAHFDKVGNISKVVGHYALSKKNPEKLTDYVMHDAATGKAPTATMKQVISAAHDQHIAIKAKELAAAQEAAKKAQKTVIPVQYSGSHYTVHVNSDGTLHKVYLTNSGKKVFDQDEGDVPSAHHQYLLHASSKVSPTLHQTVPGKVPMPKAPESVANPKVKEFTFAGKPFKEVSVTHEGKPYSVTFDEKGEPKTLESHSLNGKPAKPFTTWASAYGTPHAGQQQIIEKAKKEAGIASKPPAQTHVVETKTGHAVQVSNPTDFSAFENEKPVGFEKYTFDANGKAYDAFRSKMEKYGSEVQKSLPSDQQEAIKSYMGSGFGPMNAVMRGVPPGEAKSYGDSSAWQKRVAAARAAFDNPMAVTPVSMRLNRGIGSSTMKQLFPNGPQVGAVLHDKGIMSSSWDQSFSESWANAYDGNAAAVFQFDVPKGSKALIFPIQAEKEVMLPPNSAIRIDSIGKSASGGTLIKATFLGQVDQ